MTTAYRGVGDIINVTAGAAKSSGDVEEFADCVGVWMADTANGAIGAVAIQGEFTLAKEAPLVISQGDILYWDATNDNLDKTNTNIPAGIATADAASADTTCSVLLNPGIGA